MVVDLFFLFIMYIFDIVGSWGNVKLLMYSEVSVLMAFFFFKLYSWFSVDTDFVQSSVAF